LLANTQERLAALNGLAYNLAQFDRFIPKVDLPVGNPGGVQQVLNQASHVVCLAADDITSPLDIRVRGAELPQDLDCVANRSERTAQLMGHHPQELVLVASRVLQFPRPLL
jgi:hypothetical protein